MFKKRNVILLLSLVIILGFNIINVKAENVDFKCLYKNGTDEIIINMRGERATKVSFGVTSNKFSNSSEYTFYPANYIVKSTVLGSVQYQTASYYGFVEGNNAVYGCSKEIYLATSNNAVVYLDVVDTVNAFGTSQLVNGQGSFKIPVIFLSTNAWKVSNNKLTNTNVTLDSAIEITLSKSSYQTTTYTLETSKSAEVATETPKTTDDNIQFCYYKNSCGKVIQLKFTKGNVNMAVFDNGRGLNDWTNTSTCPTSIVDSNNLYQGKSTSCGSGATNCYSFLQQSTTENKALIQEGNCSSTSYDTNNGGVKAQIATLEIPKENIEETCKGLFGNEILEWLDENVFMIIRIGVPILLILLTSFDFAKVVFTDDKEGIQNAFKRFGKRAIAAVLIFLTPTIILIIADLVGVNDNFKDCVNYLNEKVESSN
ncbi:MAG: hypothetical protein IJ068_07025 [Bacilli bacterium]|nr:hypothetical protein [Bacilli bacterium]